MIKGSFRVGVVFTVALGVFIASACSTRAARDAPGSAGSAMPVAVDSRPPGAFDDMLSIPSGFYPWNTRTCDTRADNERTASAYQIDRNVVRCDAYRACIKAKRCPSYGHDTCTNYNATVGHEGAEKYCAWRGAELPSVGQWQKAARKDDRPYPNGYSYQLHGLCKPGTSGSDIMRCAYTNPYGMVIRMLQGAYSGEWTRDISCPADASAPAAPLVIVLDNRLDQFVVPLDPYQEFRCVRTE